MRGDEQPESHADDHAEDRQRPQRGEEPVQPVADRRLHVGSQLSMTRIVFAVYPLANHLFFATEGDGPSSVTPANAKIPPRGAVPTVARSMATLL
ncbi:hypothetical protein TUM20985_50510 [Mycobacterium antarcticum]|nr:hypothetical protein TUM20985_50510 [Mycolicibacterium sp. TUM20985]GLP81892.1 hypothetical protein TUM20984_33120 [Mycolicibacterium sp. TUM20984]